MELRAVLKSLLVSWWLVALCLALGLGGALAISLLSTPQYTSEGQLFVSTTPRSTTAEFFEGSQFSEQRVESYAQLLSGEEVAARVIEALDLDTTPGELVERVQASAVPDTVLLNFSATDSSPEGAQRIATAMADEFIELVQDLENPGQEATSPVSVDMVQAPDQPGSPSSPQVVRNLVVGAVLGLMLGVGLALARSVLDRSIRDSDAAADAAGAPAIGVIPYDSDLGKSHFFDRHASGPAAEGYRRLRNNLQFLHVDEPPKVIMVSSSVPGEGKTTLVLNLAMALVEARRKVTIIDADLRRPRVHRYLNIVGAAGLTNILAGMAELDDVIQPYGDGTLSVLASGPTPPNPSELLASGLMVTLVDQLREKNDFVLIDTPPILPVADASGLAAITDGVVLSVRHGQTRRELVERSVGIIERVDGKTLGVVLNMTPLTADISAGYGYANENGRR